MISGRPPIGAVSDLPSTSPPLSMCLFLEMEEEEETFCFADSTRFITDPDFCYQEFARREEDHFQVFRVQVGLIYLLIEVGYYPALTILRFKSESKINKC